MVGSVARSSALRFAVAAPLLVTLLTGCVPWKTQQAVPVQVPSHVRLVMVEGSSLELWQARVVADSVVGFKTLNGTTRKAVPLARVKHVQARKFSVWKSVFFVVGGAIVAYFTWCQARECD